MSSKIEVKLIRLKWVRILISSIFVITISIKGFQIMFENGIDNYEVVMVFIYVLCVLPATIFWSKISSNSPTKITIENNILTAERFIYKPIIIPLTEISEVRTNEYGLKVRGYVKSSKDIYVIKYGKKQLYLNPLNFKYVEINFDEFIKELKLMIDNAKNEVQH